MAKALSSGEAFNLIKKFIPKLGGLHKGQSGKIGVLGGSFEYTGAPYYAAISALKTGADLAHIFCDESAATAIKSYSPENIVHPVIKKDSKQSDDENSKQIVEKITKWFESIHVLVVGPGLGRDDLVMKCAKQVIQKAREQKIPLIIDGDGLFLIKNDPSVIQDYKLAILTPNVAEYGRLLETLKINKDDKDSLQQMAKKLGNVTILRKGETDWISDGETTIECREEGNSRRSGGQGDVMTGTTAAFMGWAASYFKDEKNKAPEVPYTVLAAFGGSYLLRKAGSQAFAKHLRGTTTPNIIDEIGGAFEKMFPAADSKL
eukprot:TRINITY_DN6001_c0_g1_i2.p1 TRINITY_DN6001_c0_g1~~TRINITY_DN6001_c0_g1_i2.p1  ORF type:complete len:318 (+),score=55.36 TRINITY_DN6001_c0_g1_i2:91-1044(+)